MNEDIQAQGVNVAVERVVNPVVNTETDGEEQMRLPWHRPAITRIEIRRTMLQPGSQNDGTATASV